MNRDMFHKENLQNFPKNWKVLRNKLVFSEYFGGSWGNDPVDQQTDALVRVIRVTEFDMDSLTVKENIPTIRSIELDKSSKKLIRKNDLILEKSGGGEKKPVGRVVMVDREMDFPTVNSNFTNICRPNTNLVDARFIVYSLLSSYQVGQTVRNIKQTTGIQNLDLDGFMSETILVPPIEEQKLLSSYLDKRTEQINTFIKKIQKKIELLKEKRSSLINQHVTKGLDPSIKMKDSGFEWIREIPKHWEIKKLPWVCFFQEGPGLRHWQFKEDGVPVVCVTNITPSGLNFDKYQRYISKKEYDSNYSHFTVEVGDLLIASSGNSFGKVCRYEGEFDKKFILNTSTIRLHSLDENELSTAYIKFLIESKIIQDQIKILITGAAQPNFGPTHLNQIRIPIPPKSQQELILKKINRMVNSIENLIKKELNRIDVLREYKSSLILSVVTGKFRVTKDIV